MRKDEVKMNCLKEIEREEQEKGAESLFKEIMAANISNIIKTVKSTALSS